MQKATRAQLAARKACETCHTRKVRCDLQERGFPCTNCKDAGRDDCCLHQKRRRRAARSRIVISSPIADTASRSPPTREHYSAPSNPTTSAPRVEVAPIVGIDIHSADTDGELVYQRHLVEFIDQPQLTQRPIDKDARLTYVGTEVSNLNFLVRQLQGPGTADVYHFPTNRIASRHTCHEPDRLPVEAFQLPEKHVVDELLHAYFTDVNPGFPVVDEAIFMAQYRARDPLNAPSLLLLQAILVVGAHLYYAQPERELRKSIFFRRAKSLFDARFERNRDTVVQAALLLSWHADGPEDVAANAWFWLGVAVRTATGLGMHRDADRSTIVPHNKRMWRRVWWLLVQCDVLLSLQYGRPQSINLEESDVQKLTASDFQDCGEAPEIDYVIQATELCVIVSRALRERFRLTSNPQRRQDVLRKTDEALANWHLRLPHSLQSPMSPDIGVWAANLQLLYNTALILLHRAMPNMPPSSQESREDSDICITAAGTIQSVFQHLCDRQEVKHLWISSINCLFTALIQLNIEIRFSNPILAISALRKYDSAMSSLRKLGDFWPNAQSILAFLEKSLRYQNLRNKDTAAGSENSSLSRNQTTKDHLNGSATQEIESDNAQNEESVLVIDEPAASSIEPRIRNEPGCERGIVSSGSFEYPDDHNLPQNIIPRPIETDGYGNIEYRPSWQEWRQMYSHQPELPQDFLFTF